VRFVGILLLAFGMMSCQLIAGLDRPLTGPTDGGTASDVGPPGDGGDSEGPSAYEAAVLADNPALYYRFDEPSGTLCKDRSGNGNDGELVGAFTRGDPSGVGEPADFSVHMTGGQLPIDKRFDYSFDASFAIEFWIKLDRYDRLGGNLRVVPPTNYLLGLTMYAEDGSDQTRPKVGFEKWARDVIEFAHDMQGPVLDLTRFEHIVFVAENGQPKLFVSGRFVSGGKKQVTQAYEPADFVLAIPGSLDELAIYDHALSDDQVKAHHRLGRR
jgi:hypothetical protein